MEPKTAGKKYRVTRNGEYVGTWTAESPERAREMAAEFAMEEYGVVPPPEFEAHPEG